MASQARGRREKRDTEMGLCNCVAAIFQVMIACQSITFISGQGYLYSDTEFQSRKILQDVSLFPKQQPHGGTSETHDVKHKVSSQGTPQLGVIRFEPPFLDFDTECVGMPKLRTVYIHNPDKEHDLQLSSISARTSHFHASFFDKKIVSPGGNTSFEVVFLARVVGNVENTLFINTIYGTHAYQVFGIGVPNPYRLRPYLGAKVPVNSTFSPLISMHNPTSETLQVTEMYSSSGYLQLQLPQGQHEGDKEHWEIPPYETKEVIRARFMGQVEANHTAFIRIKTAQAEVKSPDFHILPVEVEVSSTPGIYSALELLDFGILRTRYDGPKTLPLFLINSGDHEVEISSISLASQNPAIEISFKPIKLEPPSQTMFTLVANVTFSAFLAKLAADQKGTIIVKSKEKSYSNLEIPYIVNLLEGTLGYEQQGILFHLDLPKTTKEVKLSNLFKFPVVLQNLTLSSEASKIFKVLDFSGPTTLPVSLQTSAFSIQYDPGDYVKTMTKKVDKDQPSSAYHLTLHTNASEFSLPLHTFSGIISYKVLREDERKIDFGIMGTNDQRQVLFALYNHNPTKILLEKINSTLKNIQIRLVSLTQEDSGKNLTEDVDFQLEYFWLPINSCSVFEVTILATDTEEDIVDSIKILSKYQEIMIPVQAKIVVGTLTVKPEKIKFAKSFPGRVVHQTLTVVNTFAQSTKLENVHAEQVDKRFYYKKLKNQGLTLEPNKLAKIGKVYFDARQSCKPDRCYTGLPTSTTVGHHWLTTLALGPDSVEFDTKRYKEHRRRWENLQTKGLAGPNTTLVLSADVVMSVKVPTQATLYWPSLIKESSYEFPLTHVGRKSVAVLKLSNPADSPVIVQVLPLSLYPLPEAALNVLGWSDKLKDKSFIVDNSSVFHLLDPRQDTVKDSMSAQMVWLEYTLNGKLNHTVVNLFLEPGDKVDLKVEFNPYNDNPMSTVILLRNNLTILDAIPLYGRGAYEHLTLGGKAPNLQTSILRFKLTKELLKDCSRRKTNPSFTVRKWFHANNTGVLPIHITSMTVSGSPCEGYGFRVLDCDQFILQPNSSKKIEIAYTPDFTSYLVLHKLKLVTSQGNEMLFTLNVTLPPHMLPLCQEAIPRPSWEPTLYYFIVTVMLVLLVGILLMGYLESISILDTFVRAHHLDWQQKVGKQKSVDSPAGFEKTFDLRSISDSYCTGEAVKALPVENSDVSFNDKNGTSTTLTCFMKCSPHVANQPESSLPTPSKFSAESPQTTKGLFAKFLSFFQRSKKERVRKSSLTETVNLPVEDIPTSTDEVPSIINQSGPRLRHTASVNSEKRKNDKKFPNHNNFPLNSNERHSKPTAEIRPVAKVQENTKQKNSVQSQSEKVVEPEVGKTDSLCKDESRERHSESEESISHDITKKSAQERRRTCSKSSQHSRESISSSGSLDLQEPTEPEQKCSDVIESVKCEQPKVPEAKPVRCQKKLKKLSRKQSKALAREREMQEKEKVKAESQIPSKPYDDCKQIPTTGRESGIKKGHQQKRRSGSGAAIEEQTAVEDVKPVQKSVAVDTKPTRTVLSKTKESKVIQKRRSYSYSIDNNNKQKEKPGKITICKRPTPSSSSHEISESSSGESSAIWDTPSHHRDVDEDMRQISKQSQQAEIMIGVDQKKERKRGKGTSSPSHLTSGSRSSSYSSIMSSGSNDSASAGLPNAATSNHSSPNKKLSRSMSDTSGGTMPKSQYRKRSPYPPADTPNISPTRGPLYEAGQPSPQNHYNARERTLSSPSMFLNSYGERMQGVGNAVQENQDSYPTRPSQIVASSYSAFGESAFDLAGDLMSPRQMPVSPPLSTPWEFPFAGSSSLYSTPSPPATHNASVRMTSQPHQWNNTQLPVQQHSGYPAFDAPPGTPTTPGVPSHGVGWGDVPSSSAGNNMTAHSIWSVSNAVTMDDGRIAEERDPLGVRSIWSKARQYQYWNSEH